MVRCGISLAPYELIVERIEPEADELLIVARPAASPRGGH